MINTKIVDYKKTTFSPLTFLYKINSWRVMLIKTILNAKKYIKCTIFGYNLSFFTQIINVIIVDYNKTKRFPV